MKPVRRGSRAGGVALVLAAAVLWSTAGLGIKSVDMPPLALAGWRGLFAFPVVGALAVVRARSAGGLHARTLASSRWAWVAAASYALMVIAFVVATKLTTAAEAIFIQYTSPVYVALLSWPLLRERVTWRQLVACAGMLLGMVLFFREGLSGTGQAGKAVAVLSSFGAAGLPLALRAEQRRLAASESWGAAQVSPALSIAVGDAVAVLICLPAMIHSVPDARAMGIVALLGMGQVGLAYVLYALAVPRLTALEGSLLPTLEPVLNPVWVAFFQGEVPGPLAIAGGICVLGSVLFQAASRGKDG